MRAITIAAVAVIMAALTGCGATTTSSTPSNTAAAKPSPSAPALKWGPAGVGYAIDMECPDPTLHLSVTLLGVKRLASASQVGARLHSALFGVHLSIRNDARVRCDDLIGKGCRLLTANGKAIRQDPVVVGRSGTAVVQLNEVRLGPGERRSGWVWFDLKAALKPRKLQLSLSRTSSSGWNMIFGEWQL
jgi:hypothetical protein